MIDQFRPASSSAQKQFWLLSAVGIGGALLIACLISQWGLTGAALSVLVPLLLAVLTGVLFRPKFGLFLYVQLSFFLPFFSHFVSIDAPLGTAIEGILILTLLSLVVNGNQMQWQRLRNPAFYLIIFWVVFTCLAYFNPETPDRASWLVRFRTLSFQWFCAAIIVSVVAVNRRDLKVIVITWLVWSFLAALWAFKQQYIGLTASEAVWMAEAGAKTHILFGHLRSFSFYSDAAQLGAEMAGATLVCAIFCFESSRWSRRLLFLGLSIFFFWGYAVTGTRSALFVLFAGFPFYLLLKRDLVKIAIGGGLAVLLLGFLLLTNIGNSNYQIYRIRTALHPTEDPSFNLRLENQRILREHLKALPFGVGLGTSSAAGITYNPDHWAAIVQPDSAYVIVWIETGIVGVSLYVLMLIAIAGVGTYKVMRLKDPWLSTIMTALLCEFVGIIVMAYSNTIMGQFPTTTMLFVGSFLFTTCDRWIPKAEPLAATHKAGLAIADGLKN